MAHPSPYPLCIFCDERANSREHAIPKWVGKRFGMSALRLNPVWTVGLQHPRKQPVVFGSHRERIFCKGCNTHFKHLEDEAIPVLEWMARNRPITLGTTEQDVLARWGAKTGYALIAAEKDTRDLVPVDHRRMLRWENKVHPLTWVGYASWTGVAHKFAGDQSLVTPEKRTIGAYHAMVMFAGLALKVFGVYEPVPRHRLHFDTESLKQVSPRIERSISWPLFPPAGDSNVKYMAELPPLTPDD